MPDTGHYHGARLARQAILLTAAAGLLAGCSFISIDVSEFSGGKSAVTTGTARTDVEIAAALPETLAYSDAMVIGQVTARTILATMPAEPVQWTNGETGSSGTWVPRDLEKSPKTADCRGFETTVTSISGVRKFIGSACKSDSGIVMLERLETATHAKS